jgi:hypothetical protein
MIPSALLRLAAVVMATAVALAVLPAAQAKSDWQINQGAPTSVDQTVYRPNCVSADCACDCRSERFCLPACMRW